MSDIKDAMKAAGLTDEQMSSRLVQVLFVRVVEAEDLLKSAGARLEAGVRAALHDAAEGNIHTMTSGLPLFAVADMAANFDAALTRLLERRNALRVVVEAI